MFVDVICFVVVVGVFVVICKGVFVVMFILDEV